MSFILFCIGLYAYMAGEVGTALRFMVAAALVMMIGC